jgi:FKBP-type peptidyl-prolyl cis-trans isomerase (trigger factor)
MRSLPGFRDASKAPASVLVNAVGQAKFRAAVVEHVLQATLEEAMAPVADVAFKDSEKITSSPDAMASAFAGAACEPKTPLVFEMEVDVLPSITWRSPYNALRVTLPAALPDNPAAIAAAADAALAARHKELGDMRVVSGRGLVDGDIARLDLSAKRIGADGGDGELILSMQHKNMFFDTATDGAALPGLVSGMAGLTPGEKREFEVTFPDSWGVEALRGAKGRVLAACHELFDRTLPPLDDALAPQLRAGTATLAAARAAFAADAAAEAAEGAATVKREALLTALAAAADVEVPMSLIQENGRQMYSARLLELQAKGQMAPSAMRQLMTDGLVDAYIKKEQATIEVNIRSSLAVAEVQRAEGIAVGEAELFAEVASTKAEFEAWKQSYDEDKLREQATEVLGAKMVIDWLMARATVVTA